MAGVAISGLAFSKSPNRAAPLMSSTPEITISTVTMLCKMAAVRIPRTLTQVTRAAALDPTSTKPKSTSLPTKVQSVPMRMSGNRYSTALGSATASNKHTLT